MCKSNTPDNDNEFHGAFEELPTERDIKHLWTWANMPEMNACVERFNCTLQEELVSDHQDQLFSNYQGIQPRHADNLYWYNTQRPRAERSLRTPLMCWHRTKWSAPFLLLV